MFRNYTIYLDDSAFNPWSQYFYLDSKQKDCVFVPFFFLCDNKDILGVLKMHKNEINLQYKELNQQHDYVYQFVILYYNYILAKHDYGTGEQVSMMEAHTTTFIEEHPGTTVSEVARFWNKTKGAVSQTVKNLLEKGYIRKENSSKDRKINYLYVTEKGDQLSQSHKLYDTKDIKKTYDQLLETCSEQDIQSFYKVLKQYITCIKNDFK